MEVKKKSVQNNSLIDNVVCQMTDAILSDKMWNPGERLPNERQLAEQFGVSRNTMREAIKVLNATHILETKPHSGTYVTANPGINDDPLGFAGEEEPYRLMMDLYEMRMLVESAAARMAVQRASDDEVREILYYERLCRENIQSGKPWSESDREFHSAIAAASHNLAFIRIIPSIHQSAYLGYNHMNEMRNRENTLHYHALIGEALQKRDEVGAALAVRHHLMQAVEDLKSMLREKGEEIPNEDRPAELVCDI